MRARLHLCGFHVIACCAVWAVMALVPAISLGQEAGADKSVRERDLRDQLQNILRELEELQQQPTPGAATIPTPSPGVKDAPESKASEPIPQYELSDVSIVSDRVQRRPEGLSLSSTEQSETDSQPTRISSS